MFHAELFQFIYGRGDIFSLQTCDLQEAVEIHLLQIMVLRDDAAYESQKLVAVLDYELGHVD